MRRCITTDLKRAFLNLRFPLAVLFCSVIYLLSSVSEIGATDIPYILDAAMNYGAFSYLLPLIAALPYASSLIEDRNSGYLTFVFQRVSPNQYMTSRFLSVALAGAMASIFGMLLFLAVIPLFFPYAELSGQEFNVQYLYMKDVIAHRQWFSYFGFFAYLQGISGAFWAAIAVTISTFINNAQLLYVTVIVLNEVLSRLMFALGLVHLTSMASGAIDTASRSTAAALASAVFLGLTLLCFVVYQIIGRRRVRYV